MDNEIVKTLIRINYQFYQTFSDQFSATRQAVQPGVRKVLRSFSTDQSILDVGCGNGNAFRELVRLGFQGNYVGLDFSPKLIRLAESDILDSLPISGIQRKPEFLLADISEGKWELELPSGSFDHVVSFAVLHHIPGEEMRHEVLKKIRQVISLDGEFNFSVWQFLNSQRLRARIQEWSVIGLTHQQVDPGDYLLDWKSGGIGYRYIHQFDEIELNKLAGEAGFVVRSSFYSDGEENNLGLYMTWTPAK